MHRWYRFVGILLCAMLAFGLLVGCKKHEHRKMNMHQEERPGEVQEERPGEMTVD
jgi:hypothetical protein